ILSAPVSFDRRQLVPTLSWAEGSLRSEQPVLTVSFDRDVVFSPEPNNIVVSGAESSNAVFTEDSERVATLSLSLAQPGLVSVKFKEGFAVDNHGNRSPEVTSEFRVEDFFTSVHTGHRHACGL